MRSSLTWENDSQMIRANDLQIRTNSMMSRDISGIAATSTANRMSRMMRLTYLRLRTIDMILSRSTVRAQIIPPTIMCASINPRKEMTEHETNSSEMQIWIQR